MTPDEATRLREELAEAQRDVERSNDEETRMHTECAKAHSMLRELEDRLRTMADEANGPHPVLSADEAMTQIEKAMFDWRFAAVEHRSLRESATARATAAEQERDEWREMYNAQCLATSRETENSLTRLSELTAAESALAEARGALRQRDMAIRWACGEQPDNEHRWFGDAEDAATIDKRRRRYWWRTPLRKLSGIDAALARAGEREAHGGDSFCEATVEYARPKDKGVSSFTCSLPNAAHEWHIAHSDEDLAIECFRWRTTAPLAAPAGEPASSGQEVECLRCDDTGTIGTDETDSGLTDCPACAMATPPPGEQGKGGHPRGRWFCKTCRHDHLAGTGCMRARYAVDGVTIEKCDCTAEPEQGKGGGEGLREELANHLLYVHPLPWRVGRKVARNVYDAHSEGVAMFTHAYTAAVVVEAVNRLAPAQPAEHPASGGEE